MFRKVLLFTLLPVLLIACGGGGGSASTISADMTDLMFTPTDFEVTAGQVNLNLTNNGAVEHNFIVLKKGVMHTASGDVKPEDILFEAKLQPGESGQFTFTVDEPGEYEVVCNIPGHLEAGMVGKLTVK